MLQRKHKKRNANNTTTTKMTAKHDSPRNDRESVSTLSAQASLDDDEEEEEDPIDDEDGRLIKNSSKRVTKKGSSLLRRWLSNDGQPPRRQSVRILLALGTLLMGAWMVYYASTTLRQQPLALRVFQVITLGIPVGICLWLGLGGTLFSKADDTAHRRLLPLTLIVTIIAGQLPTFVGAALAVSAIVLFSLVTLPASIFDKQSTNKSSTSTPLRPQSTMSPTTILLAVIMLVAVLLTENFMVWVVSATFTPGQLSTTAPPPLQDNGQVLLLKLMTRYNLSRNQVVTGLRRLWNVQWSLVSCLGASFVVVEVWEHPRRQLYRLAARAVCTLTLARLIRTISFVLTVLPSQVSNCYLQRFPYPPPDNWYDWILVGLRPASHGGCNDLIISGHATVTATLACVATSVSGNAYFAAVLWFLLSLDYAIEIYEGFHYSVDMWLGMILVSLLWRVLDFIEDDKYRREATNNKSLSNGSASNQKRLRDIQFGDWILYSIPAVIAYLQATILPKVLANGVIVLYVLATIVLYVGFSLRQTNVAKQQAYQHCAQHVLYCLLFLALAIYL